MRMTKRLSYGLVVLLAACAPGALARSTEGPVNTSLPTIAGQAKAGGTVSADPGTWTSSSGNIDYSYAWHACDGQGNACQPLPYTSQSVTDLRAPVGSTIRVVVTATDTSGSSTATSAAVAVQRAKTTIVLVSPKDGAVVHTSKVTITLKVTSTVSVRSVNIEGSDARRGANGTWSITERADPGTQTIRVAVDDGSAGAHKAFTFTVVPRVTPIQEYGRGGELTAPGCFTCTIRDARGDDRNAPPDIKSVTSTYRNGWIVMTFVTYDSVSPDHGVHPCIQAITKPGANQVGFVAGCFEGAHIGMISGEACGKHADANGDCGSAHMSFPNSHATVYRFRPSQIGKPASFFWQAWVLYPGDRLGDTVPTEVSLRMNGLNCWVKQQLRPQPAGAYRWGRNRCARL
jgi:hypothetical protein